MAEPSNDELKIRIEQLERLVSGLMVEIVNRTAPMDRAGLSWSFDGVIDPDTEFGRSWAERARAIGLNPRA